MLPELVREINTNFYFNVMDYGAIGDKTTDNTKAFNDALTAALNQGGGVVLVPPGKYLFSGNINIP